MFILHNRIFSNGNLKPYWYGHGPNCSWAGLWGMIDMFLGMGQCVIMGWPRLMATFTLHFAMETYMIIDAS